LKEVEQQSKETDASSSNSGSGVVGNTTILSSNSNADKTPGSPNEADIGQDSSAGANSRMAYDKTISFFDNISCEAKERLISGKPPRTSFAEQRRLDAETFGQLSLHDRHSNSHRYRGGQSSRGSSRGRGSNNNGSAPRSSYHNNNTSSSNSINTVGNNHHHSTQPKPTQTKVFRPVNHQKNGQTKQGKDKSDEAN